MLILALCLLHLNTAHALFEPNIDALTSIFNQTRGETWKRNENWLLNTNVCTWFGVRCVQDEW